MASRDIFCGGISGWFVFAVFMTKVLVVIIIVANRKKARPIVDCRDVETPACRFFWLESAGKINGTEEEFIHFLTIGSHPHKSRTLFCSPLVMPKNLKNFLTW